MKVTYKKSLIPSIVFTLLTMMIVATLGQVHITFGQAVDLIPIQSGNTTLDKGLPEFYDCIDEKIDASKGVEVDSYFEKEPTKHEVSTCYSEVFIQNTDTESTDSTDTESTDSTDTESTDSTDTESTDNTDTESTDNTDTESTDNTDTESTDNEIHSEIERFNSLFGVTG
ncbi:MAG TPA: hypothetical protein VJR94_08280 [Candidatus Nitrosocosmicus sp.]|nr:hypothetical protein [Candidatus Nitrosocosmicus sp.]